MIRFAVAAAIAVFAALPLRADVDIVEVDSPGGINAWLVEEPSIPFVALEIVFRGGTSLDDPAKRGAVNLMTALIEEGAGELDAQGFARARDDLAMSLSFSSWDDGVSVSAKFLTETTDEAAALMRLALTQARFDESAVDRVRAQVLANLRSDAEDPESIAGEALSAALFGDHPYGSNGDGTLETVAALSQDDLVAAYQGALARDRVYVGAAGDISPEALATLLDTVLGDLPAMGAPLPDRADADFGWGLKVVDYPTPQAVIRFAQPGLPRNDPDFFAAYVMSQVLGAGGFESRLMTEIREKRGLTYGVAAYLQEKDGADLMGGGMSTANATVAESIELIRAEWEKMRSAGLTQDELDRAKTYLTGAYPLRFDGNGRIANILVGMQLNGLTRDYINTRNAKVEAVTLEDVARVAKRVMQPEKLSFLVVGQPEGLSN